MNLYNKYRPKQFDDVAQPHVTRVLKAQFEQGNTRSTYLLSGPPGTGKTTLARIMAMRWLCTGAEDGSAVIDVDCDSCQQVISNNHRDVIEENCSDKTSVDDVRSIIQSQVRVVPLGAYRIFILDECHMFSKSAQDALLKILEETPSHVKFVLCTTDPQKLRPAVRSRCQHHALRPVSEGDVQRIVRNVCNLEGIECTEDGLDMIVEYAQGGLRDALQLVEHVQPIGGVTADNVSSVLGRTSSAMARDFLLAVQKPNRREALSIMESARQAGVQPNVLFEDSVRLLARMVRTRLFNKAGSDTDPIIKPLIDAFPDAGIVAQLGTSLARTAAKLKDSPVSNAAAILAAMAAMENMQKAHAQKKA